MATEHWLGGAAAEALGDDPVPAGPYHSPEYFKLETERVFRRAWLNVARVEDLADHGSFVVRDLPNLRASILVTRDASGDIRAFHNTCTHRGNRLVRNCSGRQPRFVCDYHGWTFDSTGALRGVPDRTQFRGLDRQQLGLKPLAVEVWNGFVFVRMASEGGAPLRDAMVDLDPFFEDYPFDRMERVATFTCNVRANWKVCMDIGSEAYHVRFVHRASAPDSHVSEENPLAHLPKVWLHRLHRSTSLRTNPQHELRPAEAIVARHAATVIQSGSDAAQLPRCLNRGGSDNWGFDTHILFPNFGLLLGSGWYVTHHYWPITVNETRWETSLNTFAPSNAGQRLSQEFSAVLTRDLIREDWAQVENVQRGLESGALDQVQFSEQEVMLRHAFTVIDDVVHGRLAPDGRALP